MSLAVVPSLASLVLHLAAAGLSWAAVQVFDLPTGHNLEPNCPEEAQEVAAWWKAGITEVALESYWGT